jgi:hypothetical protein
LGENVAILEDQLTTWTHLGSVQQSSSTYQGIKSVLERKDAPYSGRSVDSFLQGSYCNDTNIFGDSDVDIVLRTRALFHYNIDALPEPQKAEFNRVHPHLPQYKLGDFRKDVVTWLQQNYGTDLDTSGKKTLNLKAHGNRRSSDILLVAPHKKFTRYLGDGAADQTSLEGVLFITTDGTHVINYPKQHSDNMTAKHQASNNWLKPTVRIYKNMRNRMVERGFIKAGAAPSYFLEGVLSSVTPDQFGKSWSATVQNAFAWIEGHKPGDYMCANGIHPLIRDNTPTSWSVQGYIDWLGGMKQLWNTW